MSILWLLFCEFFVIGSFSVGGGLATLPFLYNLSEKYTWFSQAELVNMIAISESTPGPIGVNMATYAGYKASGVLGGIIATLGLIVPALILVILIASAYEKFKENKYVQKSFYGIRPAVAALVFSSAWGIINSSLFRIEYLSKEKVDVLRFFNIKALMLFVLLYYLLIKFKKHPIFYIGLSAVVGVIFMK